MKRSLLALAVAASVMLTACGADEKEINGVVYDTCGIFSMDNCNPNIQYKTDIWSIVWGVLLFETIAGPIYFFGYDLYEPVGPKDPNWVPGQISPVPAK